MSTTQQIRTYRVVKYVFHFDLMKKTRKEEKFDKQLSYVGIVN